MYDIKNLGKLKRLDENNAEAMKAFWAFDRATFVPGAIDALHKQLMAVAVALTTQCPYCIELHVKAAREAGATEPRGLKLEAPACLSAQSPRRKQGSYDHPK